MTYCLFCRNDVLIDAVYHLFTLMCVCDLAQCFEDFISQIGSLQLLISHFVMVS